MTDARHSTSARIALLTLLLTMLAGPAAATASHDALWAALRQGKAVALIRHALAPGFGDPVNFKLGDCTTQRNLNAVGRKQSSAIGALFRKNGIADADVYTSQWCRCRETAKFLGLGAARDLPMLNSFFDYPQRRAPQTRQLRAWLKAKTAVTKPLVLVTHQVNISALTGRITSSGEIVFVKLPFGKIVQVLGTTPTR